VTYLRDGVEYLTRQEQQIFNAIKYLNGKGRSTNNSQIAADTGISRTTVGHVTAHLRARGFIKDVSKKGTGAYHWRLGGKTPPDTTKSHGSWGHGLEPGTQYDMNCLACRKEREAGR
jgi:biotin operon repressor